MKHFFIAILFFSYSPSLSNERSFLNFFKSNQRILKQASMGLGFIALTFVAYKKYQKESLKKLYQAKLFKEQEYLHSFRKENDLILFDMERLIPLDDFFDSQKRKALGTDEDKKALWNTQVLVTRSIMNSFFEKEYYKKFLQAFLPEYLEDMNKLRKFSHPFIALNYISYYEKEQIFSTVLPSGENAIILENNIHLIPVYKDFFATFTRDPEKNKFNIIFYKKSGYEKITQLTTLEKCLPNYSLEFYLLKESPSENINFLFDSRIKNDFSLKNNHYMETLNQLIYKPFYTYSCNDADDILIMKKIKTLKDLFSSIDEKLYNQMKWASRPVFQINNEGRYFYYRRKYSIQKSPIFIPINDFNQAFAFDVKIETI